jgi:receptor protein-tyrosine kinase
MRSLLQALRETQDHVIIDAPPLLPVTDSAVLSVLADGCLITTRFGRTRQEQLVEAAATLSRIDAKLLGVVLNRVPQTAAVARRFGYGYDYRADPGEEPVAASAVPGRRTYRAARRAGRRGATRYAVPAPPAAVDDPVVDPPGEGGQT